jgi:hypothetical protein
MDEKEPFPGHIHREEELWILQEVARVREDRLSRALFLYGPGSIGKTSLVRELARSRGLETRTIWVEPIDVDDSEFWLLSNLERRVVGHLDPEAQYFSAYYEYISRLPNYTRPRIGHETVVSHLGRIKRVFTQCYKEFVEKSGKTPVIVFDTVEAIRGMYLLTTLTQWMKALPATLFILSGRAMRSPGGEKDPIKYELEDPHQPMPCTTIHLSEFGEQAALDYLRGSRVVTGLSEDEKAKLVRLTRGHPLWLAFTIAYLRYQGMPEEANQSIADIDRQLPYGVTPYRAGLGRVEAFKRRLVTSYRDTDFWHESDKRLAVVRQSVSKETWRQLMSDRPLSEGVASHDEAWSQLLRTPWIRARANQRCVTLHDAVAEELAQRIIPVHDQNERWRQEQWQRAVRIYAGQIEAAQPALSEQIASMDSRLHLLGQELRLSVERRVAMPDESAFIDDVARLDADKRDLNQLKATLLYYQLLSDYNEGCRLFLDLFGQARHEHDILFQELLVLEMQRFLPGGVDPDAASDVTGGAISEFRQWLTNGNSQRHLEIGLSICGFLIENEQVEAATKLLTELPEDDADVRQRYCLQHHRESDSAFREILDSLDWSLENLWTAISATALLKRPLNEPWQEIHEAIRRLLYRYYFPSEEQRAEAHREARMFVEVWADGQTGTEQVIGLVECLWRETAVLRLTQYGEMAETLSESAKKLSQALKPTAAFTVPELQRYAVERMRKDEEFREALRDVPGLFDRLVAIVKAPS